jgi:predicted nuclease with TOPRIM domain
LDARLAEYTLDFSQFPSGQFSDAKDDNLLDLKEDADDKLSDVGGPEDFTANMEKYLMGDGMSSVRKLSAHREPGSDFLNTRQAAVEEEAESGDYSEFGPPVDMSTPSHLLHRTSALARDSTQLEDIEEDPADDLESPASPSLRKLSNASEHEPDEPEDWEVRLHRRIAHLEEELRNRDEHIQKNRNRVLEAASAGEQIRHLQAELQRKNALIEEIESQGGDEAILREQVESLRKQNSERERLLQQSSMQTPDLSMLQKQIHDMQHQLQNRDSQSSLDAERLETIAHLRQQLNHTQEQLKKRDTTLEETILKLKEVTQARESQVHEKNAEIDRLKAEIDDQALENERLETEIERVNTDYQALEDRLTALETKNQPLEDKNSSLEDRNSSLEADLTRVQSQVEAQENALRAAAADLPLGNRSTYSEILDLIKDLGHSGPDSPLKEKFSDDFDVPQLGQEFTRLQQELEDALAAQKAADAEANRLRDQAAESQIFITTIEAENSRLITRVHELSSTLTKTQHELTRTQEDHAESLETVARLQEEALGQPPSPPPSPTAARGGPNAEQSEPAVEAALEAAHQDQIRSLQTAHSTAISTLRSSHAESMRKIRNMLTTAEQREAELRTDLTTLRASVSTQEFQLRKTFKSEIKRLEAVIAAKDESAAAVDERIALSVEKREREWERRVDLLLKERDRMAKALMMYWGEKEMGRGPGVLAEGKGNRRRDGDPADAKSGQAYRYKYAEKHGEKPEKRKSKSGERKV